MTAAALQHRKSRYQLFLFQLLLMTAFSLWEVLLPSDFSLLATPCQMALQRLLPNIYTTGTEVRIHQYLPTGMLFVSVTTLALFFLSGTYSDKIAYANNRRRPLPTRHPLALNPSSHMRSARLAIGSTSSSVPIPPIPPTTNPRGELRFSSRVDRVFRDNYERYRANFERKRAQQEFVHALKNSWFNRWRWRWRQSDAPTTSQASAGISGSGASGAAADSSRSATPPVSECEKPKEQKGAAQVQKPSRGVTPPETEREGDVQVHKQWDVDPQPHVDTADPPAGTATTTSITGPPPSTGIRRRKRRFSSHPPSNAPAPPQHFTVPERLRSYLKTVSSHLHPDRASPQPIPTGDHTTWDPWLTVLADVGRWFANIGNYIGASYLFMIAPPFIHNRVALWDLQRLEHRLSAFQTWVWAANAALFANPFAQSFVILSGIFGLFGFVYTVFLTFRIGDCKAQFSGQFIDRANLMQGTHSFWNVAIMLSLPLTWMGGHQSCVLLDLSRGSPSNHGPFA
ncbi:hypothetical protein DFH09DRAFT_1138115, partial [Mycena vulgaris]